MSAYPIRKYLILCFLAILMANSYSQVLFQGHVSDAVMNESISGVSVEIKAAGFKTKTNAQGNFVFLDPEYTPGNTGTLKGKFSTQGNILIWDFNTSIRLKIYSQAGALQFSSGSLSATGYLSLDQLRNGLYLILLNSDKGNAAYKLVAIQHFLSVSQQLENTPSQKPEYSIKDTLILRHPDYYPIEIEVEKGRLPLNLKMVRKYYDELDYLTEIRSKEAFDLISNIPSKSFIGKVRSMKIILDARDQQLYYMNTNLYTNHFHFAFKFDLFKGSIWAFNHTQYLEGSLRYLYPATLNYFPSLDIYTFEFFPGDGATCEEVEDLYSQIMATSFFGDKLYFYQTNDSWSNCNNIPVITANDLYAGQKYQALNQAESYGYLRKIEVNEIENTCLNKRDIVVLNGIPFDIPVVSGIITTEFQTPLSHINVLSHNRGTPNMAYRDAWISPDFENLYDQLVYLQVKSDTFTLRAASYEEAQQFWSTHEPQNIISLEQDLDRQGLVELETADIKDVKCIGGKAANFAELLNAFEEADEDPPVPEDYFALPFYYYSQHISSYGLDKYIDQMLKTPDFYSNSAVREAMLEKLRDSIIESPLNSDLLQLINNRLQSSAHFSSFRFRSSTNAEDLEGFNGAGLYNSFTGRVYDPERPPDEAIKKVWASLWNFRAFEEREYFKIDHQTCAMGVLVHRSFPDEDANGVAITKNLYGENHGFIINVQFGEHSIVNPEPGVLHDQIILYQFSISEEDPFTPEYISHSNIATSELENVLSNEELFELGNYLLTIKTYFFDHVYGPDCEFEDFGLDLEFKVASEISPRKIYLKQVRPY